MTSTFRMFLACASIKNSTRPWHAVKLLRGPTRNVASIVIPTAVLCSPADVLPKLKHPVARKGNKTPRETYPCKHPGPSNSGKLLGVLGDPYDLPNSSGLAGERRCRMTGSKRTTKPADCDHPAHKAQTETLGAAGSREPSSSS